MAQLQAPYWGNVQKMQFKADAGAFVQLQNNPSKFKLVPLTQVQAMLPATMGPLIINGPIEYPPQAIALHWDSMSKADYDQLAQYMHLQMVTMIDMEDRGWYGTLQLTGFDYEPGATQKVGSVDAIFMCVGPAPGLHSTINSLSAPATPSQVLSLGGSQPAGTTTWYCMTWFTIWGAATDGLSSRLPRNTARAVSGLTLTRNAFARPGKTRAAPEWKIGCGFKSRICSKRTSAKPR